METKMKKDLSVQGESVQRVFGFYRQKKLMVNRRYQRKLVWTLEEKQAFIDSLLKGFPVPIFLLAETKHKDNNVYEIIDGMQRLNAILSFIEGDFSLGGMYFDLETMADTKRMLDEHELAQKRPVMPRGNSVEIANYILPLSIYSFDKEGNVDEVFRRINSNGRHLSRQDLRSAGATGLFPTLVRRVSEEIRGDTSQLEILPLSAMKRISINNKSLDYGINADEIYWIRHGIVTKEMLRESKDEELIANCIAYMALPDSLRTSSTILDELYGFKDGEKQQEIEYALQQLDTERIREQFIKTHDLLSSLLAATGKDFISYALDNKSQAVPRYYEVVFLAFYDSLYRDNKEVKDFGGLVKSLKDIGGHITITTGGNWSAVNRQKNIDGVSGVIKKYFKKRGATDPMTSNWVTEFKTLLAQSYTEQSLYDFKQGFCRLDKSNSFDEGALSKVVKTLSAMANFGQGVSGYVCIGVADKKQDADKIRQIHGVSCEMEGGFYITGVDHEVSLLNKSYENWYKFILNKIKSQPISVELIDNIRRNARLIKFKSKSILILSVKNSSKQEYFDGKYYQRVGPEVEEVPVEKYPEFFSSFKNKLIN
jgi:hypothetical protein